MFVADTGSGGLNETTPPGVATVNAFYRKGDPNEPEPQLPAIEVEVLNTEGRSFGNRQTDTIVRIHVFTEKNGEFNAGYYDNINQRIIDVYDGIAPATGTTGWTFSIMNHLRDFPAQAAEGNQLHHVHEFSLRTEL